MPLGMTVKKGFSRIVTARAGDFLIIHFSPTPTISNYVSLAFSFCSSVISMPLAKKPRPARKLSMTSDDDDE